MPQITLIVPIYNTAAYLPACLDSIAAQTFDDIEVLLVDDGSTDQSPEIAQRYAERDPRFRYIRQPNSGASAARNTGIRAAKGEYIAFIDSDDWVAPTYTDTLRHTDADIAFFGCHVHHDDATTPAQTITLPSVRHSDRGNIEAEIIRLTTGAYGEGTDVLGWTWDKVFRADIIHRYQVRFNEAVSFREDELFTLQYCRHATSLQLLSDVPYHYRIRTGGLTAHGMRHSDMLPSAIELEQCLAHFTLPALRGHLIRKLTQYRARDIYGCPRHHLPARLAEYADTVHRLPQPPSQRPVHLTQYLRHGLWAARLYAELRRLTH